MAVISSYLVCKTSVKAHGFIKTNSSSHRCFVKALATAYINNLPSKYMYPVVSTRSYHLNV